MMGRIWALALLGWALLSTIGTWPFRRRRALRAFRNNYGPEGLLPVSPEVHAALIASGRCTACGRCDRVSTRAGTQRLSELVRGWTRSLPDAPLAAAEFDRYSAAELEEAERLCPFDVPIAALAQLSRRQSAGMNAALP